MKGKKFHTLQAKLTLLVSMIILTSLIFSFGNFYLSGVINREYTCLLYTSCTFGICGITERTGRPGSSFQRGLLPSVPENDRENHHEISGRIPVSYTHLDVYKRQGHEDNNQ